MSLPKLSVLFLIIAGTRSQQCRNEYGEPVDWFFLYKLPKLQQGNDFFLRKGLAYIYISSRNSTSDWRPGLRNINDTKSLVGQTLGPLYNESLAGDLSFIMYNDDPPDISSTSVYGHTKGVVFSDGKTGVWLIHSSPKFPKQPFREVHMNKTENSRKKIWSEYVFPLSATKFGQSFLCITMPATELDKVGNALMYNRPKIYSLYLTPEVKERFPNFTLAANNSFINKPPWNYKTVLTSSGNDSFTVYAKGKKYDKDLYAAFIAPDLQSDLDVESWMNGAGDLPSYCRGNFSVKNVLGIAIRMEMNLTYRFKSTQDHSKWSVSNKKQETVCVGDINRMESQLKRGGGSVCLRNSSVWKKFKRAVDDVEACQKPLHKLTLKTANKSTISVSSTSE